MSLTALAPHWGLQPFEDELAGLELEGLTGRVAAREADGWTVSGRTTARVTAHVRERAALARAVRTSAGDAPTVQHHLEVGVGGGRRKVTSHALHGLHAYKGKFYPQLARAALNASGVTSGGRVLDPFAGCGTTVLEAALLGLEGHGVDANPLAVLVSQAKLSMLSVDPDRLEAMLAPLRNPPKRRAPVGDADYISEWLPRENFQYLGRLLGAMAAMPDDARAMAMVVVSSVLREASLQEPSQLRVYRRKQHASVPALADLLPAALDQAVEVVARARTVVGVDWDVLHQGQQNVRFGDARRLITSLGDAARPGSFDAVVTSPPYANALPYIDTDRLSLRAFGLLGSSSQRVAEQRLIGNREINTSVARELNNAVDHYLQGPAAVPLLTRVLTEARASAGSSNAGFRRQRTPGLLFAYFRDMDAVLAQSAELLRPAATAVWVVGDSTFTGSDGSPVPVPTTDILIELARPHGLELERDLGKRLTSFGASSTVHQRNAMESERVVVFRRRVA